MNIIDLLFTVGIPLSTVGIMGFTVWAERWLKDESISK